MRTEATIARGEMRFASGRPVAMIADSRPRYSPVGCPLRLSSALAKSRSSNVIESPLSQARGAAPRGRGEFAAARPRWNSQARALPPRSAGRGGSRGSGLASAGAAPSRTRESFRQVFREASWTASSAAERSFSIVIARRKAESISGPSSSANARASPARARASRSPASCCLSIRQQVLRSKQQLCYGLQRRRRSALDADWPAAPRRLDRRLHQREGAEVVTP